MSTCLLDDADASLNHLAVRNVINNMYARPILVRAL